MVFWLTQVLGGDREVRMKSDQISKREIAPQPLSAIIIARTEDKNRVSEVNAISWYLRDCLVSLGGQPKLLSSTYLCHPGWSVGEEIIRNLK